MIERGDQSQPPSIVLVIRLAIFYCQWPLIAVVILLTYISIRQNESVPNFDLQSTFLSGCAAIAGIVIVCHLVGVLLNRYWGYDAKLSRIIFKNDMRAALFGVLDWGLLFAICMMTFGIDLLGHGYLELKARLTWGLLIAVIGGAGFGIILGRRLNQDRSEMQNTP